MTMAMAMAVTIMRMAMMNENVCNRVPDGAELVDSQSSGLELQLADRSSSKFLYFYRILLHFFAKNETGSVLIGKTSLWGWP